MKGALKALLLALITLAASCGYTFAQVDRSSNKQFMGSVMVGTDTTALLTQSSSAWLQIGRDSTNKGLLLPRVGDTSDVTDPVPGLVIFSHADSAFYVYKDHWVPVGSSRDLAAYLKKADSLTAYVTPTELANDSAKAVPLILTRPKANGSTVLIRTYNTPITDNRVGVLTLYDRGMAKSLDGAVLSVHADDQSPYLAKFYNDGESKDTAVFAYYATTAGELQQGTLGYHPMSLFVNGLTHPAITITPNSGYGTVKIEGLAGTGTRLVTTSNSGVLGTTSLSDIPSLTTDNTFSGINSFSEAPIISSSTAGHNAIYFSDASGGTGSSSTYNVVGFNGTSFYFTPANKSNAAQFSANGLTARRTYTLPDNSGNLWTSGGDDSTSGHIHVAGEAWFGGIAGFGGTPASPYATINGLGQASFQTLASVANANTPVLGADVDGNIQAADSTKDYVPYSQSTLDEVTRRGATTTSNIYVSTSSAHPWGSGFGVTQIGGGSAIMTDLTNATLSLVQNAYYDGTDYEIALSPSIVPSELTMTGAGDFKFWVGSKNAVGSSAALVNVANIYHSGVISAVQYTLSQLNTAPSSATDTGTTGEIRITSDYIYVCIATNTWVRAALSTW